ncbi:MAG: SDR family NAD(P)-dependent oxidoreductase, partial [Oscillospiraceae bacterium]|nr:SDR family NAD(P)-dependent oxidoreductase [Oscillospiraceae bacterium]
MNKTVLVTGASRGIGRETALLFAQNGYNVIINYNQSEDSANSLLNEIKSQGGSAIAVKCDVANESEVSDMFSQIKT